MNVLSNFASLLLVGFVVANYGCSGLPRQESEQDYVAAQASQWKIVPDENANTTIAQKEIDGGLVSVKCESDGCRTLVVTDGVCDFNGMIPVLINTAVESTVAFGQCSPISDPDAAEWANSLIVLLEANLLLPYMILGDDVSLAVPMSDGEIRVYLVTMAALRELIAPLRPDLFESPGWLNEHELEPLPDDDAMDDDELILWRRGLLSI